MNVSDIMTANPVTIDKGSSLYKALESMYQVGCHHLPVIGSEGHLIGIISANDCRLALEWPSLWHENWQKDERAHKITVASVMTAAPIVIEPDAPAHEAARLMLEQDIRCLPVMRVETLIGILTTSDILMAFINSSKRSLPRENLLVSTTK
jgi:acetoin utilization protein AcuB